MTISALVVIIMIGNTMRIIQPGNIRMVEALSLITMGAGLGVLLVNFMRYIKLKKNS